MSAPRFSVERYEDGRRCMLNCEALATFMLLVDEPRCDVRVCWDCLERLWNVAPTTEGFDRTVLAVAASLEERTGVDPLLLRLWPMGGANDDR